MRNLRRAATITFIALLAALFITPPASAHSPTPHSQWFTEPTTPTADAFEPTSSTEVKAGEKVYVAYNFKNVIARPLITLYFRKGFEQHQVVPFSVATNWIDVPETWTAGKYRLEALTIDSIDNSKGIHLRHHFYVGLDENKNIHPAVTKLNLQKLDITVTP